MYPVKAWEVLFLREMGRIDVRRKVLVSCVGNRLERSKRRQGVLGRGHGAARRKVLAA